LEDNISKDLKELV